MSVFKLFPDALEADLAKFFQTLVVEDLNFLNIKFSFDLKEFVVLCDVDTLALEDWLIWVTEDDI